MSETKHVQYSVRGNRGESLLLPNDILLPCDGPWHLVRVPATVANLGAGYDAVALALDEFSWFFFRRAERDGVLNVTGADCHLIPKEPSNHAFFQSADQAAETLGFQRPPMEIIAHSDLPLRCGFGSSAAVRLAGVVATHHLAERPLTRDEAFAAVARSEGHSDNAGAATFGGLVCTAEDSMRSPRALCLPIPSPLPVSLQVLVPTIRKSSTMSMRSVLPLSVAQKDATYNLQNLAMLVAGWMTGEVWAIKLGCRDRLHQQYRGPMTAGVNEVLSLGGHGDLLGATIAGAGPAILLLHRPGRPEACDEALRVFGAFDAGASLKQTNVSSGGYSLLTDLSTTDFHRPDPPKDQCCATESHAAA